MHVCDVSPYVFVVRDSVGGRALSCLNNVAASNPVHVSGDGRVVPTTKSEQMDPIFAWEVLFALRVCVWGGRGSVPMSVLGNKVFSLLLV